MLKIISLKLWGVEQSRIKIQARNLPRMASRSDTSSGREENRRVEIIGSDIITGSVLTVDTLRKISMSKLVFEPKIDSDYEIEEWRIIVNKDNNIVKEFTGKKLPKKRPVWTIDNQSNPELFYGNRFKYLIEVENKLGLKYQSPPKFIPIDRLTVDRKRLEQKSDTEFEYYSLILFDYGKSRLGPEHKKLVDFVKDRVETKSKVKVFGYSDSVGDENINKRIARLRAESVAKRLNIPGISYEGIGESKLLYDNSLPEGRFYCRTVQIEIETPVGKQ